jgi:hypothetical protein
MELASASDELASLTEQLQNEISRFELRAETAENAWGQGLPAGVTPEMLNQLILMMQQKQNGGDALSKAPSGPTATPKPAASGVKPSDILPLDDDERGYGNF